MPTIGARIRSLRKARGLSLEGLAAHSGVALATLSRLENGKAGGTLTTHQKIAEGLRSSLADLYRDLDAPEAPPAPVIPARRDAERFQYDEKASAILLATQVSRKRMLPQLLTLHPKGRTALEHAPPGTERWVFGLRGAVEVQVGAERYRVPAGHSLYFKADQPHRFRNLGRAVAKCLSVTTPVVL
ncbi:MAG: helix-turn-helix transcriptional regulator [Candidatus Omnitrophica bacterium]|nr:helix-turn-helix transcriptional regulator [Candidatus Omnitrophota bacterium]